jgi:CheY-like chemotaxis protein
VQLHGGAVRAYSEGTGRGSEFVVRLPLLETQEALPPLPRDEVEKEENGALRPAHPLRVVVVEDQDDVRDALVALLEGWGHRVEAAADGAGAVELIVGSRPDVALVDIGLPGLDGYSVARRVRAELGPGSPRLVALTGFGRDEDRDRARRAGFDTHLTKPAGPKELRRVLRSDTDGDSPRRENEQRQDPTASPSRA